MSQSALPPLEGKIPSPNSPLEPNDPLKANPGRPSKNKKIATVVLCLLIVAALVLVGIFVGKPAYDRWRALEDVRSAITGTWYGSSTWAEFTRETRRDFNEDGQLVMTSGAMTFTGTWTLTYEDDSVYLSYSIDDFSCSGTDYTQPMPGYHGKCRIVATDTDSITCEGDESTWKYYSTEDASYQAAVAMLTGSDESTHREPPSVGDENSTLNGSIQEPGAEAGQEENIDDIQKLYGTWYVYQDGYISYLDLGSDNSAALEDYGAFWAREFQLDGKVYGGCDWSYDDSNHTLRLFSFWVRCTDFEGKDYSLGGSLNEAMSESFEVLSVKQTRVDTFETRVMELKAEDGSVVTMYSNLDAAMAAEEGR